MPRDLFGDVTSPSIKIGNRKWYSVPVSLGSHLLVVGVIVLIPIFAPGLLPAPEASMVVPITPVLPPEPPRPSKPHDDMPTPPANPDAAPTIAPTEIGPERPKDPDIAIKDPWVGVIGGGGDKTLDPPPVVKPAPPADPLHVGGIIRPPTKIREAPLVYPAIAQAARVQGIVIIEAVIGTDGRVTNAKVLRSVPLLDQAALEAVKTWEYSPTLLNGIPVAVIMTVVVQFQLQG